VPVAEVVGMMYRECGHEPRIRPTPQWLLNAIGLFVSTVRELKEMLYQWQRPFVVDHTKFATRFWGDATPLAEGVAATMAWYRERR
jgi:nucleoside-diphosphate-sugar epimerase